MAEKNELTQQPLRRPFFIATRNGDGAVFSEHIETLRKSGGDTYATTIAPDTVAINAPLEVVRDLMEEHGYDWVDQDELKERATKYGDPKP